MGFKCPYCDKDLDIMTIHMDSNLRFVFEALPSFGRYASAVMGYAALFGITPFTVKAAKLKTIIAEMKRLFEAQSFKYEKKLYQISHAGIAEALDTVLKKNFDQHLDNHNYLKKVMITIADRESRSQAKQVDTSIKQREDMQRSTFSRPEAVSSAPHSTDNEPPPDSRSPEQIADAKMRIDSLIKGLDSIPAVKSNEFICKTNNWKMTKQICMERQSTRSGCRDCQQGKMIAAELGDVDGLKSRI